MLRINQQIQDVIYVEESKDAIAHLNASFDREIQNFNISIYVVDKELFNKNQEIVKEKYMEFYKEVIEEAKLNGWCLI